MLEIIGMMGTVSGGTEDALSQIDIPQDGIIRAVDWDAYVNLDADLETAAFELSFIATSQVNTNDTRGRISSIGVMCIVVSATSAYLNSLQKFVGPFELVVAGGERLFLHSAAAAGVTGVVRANLHFDGGAAVTRRSARR